MNTLLVATRNTHKVGEIRAILGEQFYYLTLKDFPNAPEVVEDADTFVGNAIKKAVDLAGWLVASDSGLKTQDSRLSILADDSGLEVDALDGAPGVYSARFAALDAGIAGNSPDADNNAKLLRLLKNVPWEKRTARFRCVIALVKTGDRSPMTGPMLFEGICEGHIAVVPAGENGFGYDPLFIPVGYETSFAQLDEGVKNGISHRARALGRLRDYWIASGGFSV